MKVIKIIIFIIQISLILNEKLNGVYTIKSTMNGKKLTINNGKFNFRGLKYARLQSFRIIPLDSGLYLIESSLTKKEIGVNDNDDLILFDKNGTHYWNIIELKDKEFLIQYANTKKFIESTISYTSYVKCSKIIYSK